MFFVMKKSKKSFKKEHFNFKIFFWECIKFYKSSTLTGKSNKNDLHTKVVGVDEIQKLW